MEIENTKPDFNGGVVKRAEAFLANPRTLSALTFGFLALTLTTKEPALFFFDLVLTMSFAYRATGAVIAEIKAS